MGGNLGDAIAPLAAGAMLAVIGWREVMVLNVVPGILASGLILLLVSRWPEVARNHVERAGQGGAKAHAAKPGALAAVKVLLTNRAVLMLSLGSAVRSMTAMTLMTFVPVYLSDDLAFPPAWVGGAMFAMQAAGFIAAPITGHLSDRVGRRRIIITSMTMSGVVLLFMVFAGRSSAFVFLVAFLGFFLFAIRAVLQAWVLDATPKSMAGTSIGLLFGTQAVGAAVGPIVGGILADHCGIMAAFYFLAVSIIAANMFIFFTPEVGGEAHRQETDQPDEPSKPASAAAT